MVKRPITVRLPDLSKLNPEALQSSFESMQKSYTEAVLEQENLSDKERGKLLFEIEAHAERIKDGEDQQKHLA